ncbi:hypothetical protein [Micavibrio aeruginosavorus]|uniref:Uncharacterized protein n=1 Tax=Micavibrio aeruginosavorus (strain ARL-13) TaxID=856793 RepID=G2KSX4_MICAA|nr:hypothetical protein [Micavibrio aeruginosavorus]AEP10119.1 hypothetical protein MICA_1808 [Micavibrio aeruginosavorus ARL-13]
MKTPACAGVTAIAVREKKNPPPGEGDGFFKKLEPFAKEEAGKLHSHPSSLTAKYGQIKGRRPKNKAKIGGFLRFFVRVLLSGLEQGFDF